MSTPRPFVGCLVGAMLALSGCGSDGPQWSDFTDARTDVVVGDVVVETDEFLVTDADVKGGCAQLTVADVISSCLHHEAGIGGYMGRAARVADTRFIEVRTDPSTRAFVVWSNVARSGRSVEPIYAADNGILVWIMEPGEEPWGVQVLGPTGELAVAIPFVGLPGN